MSVDDRTWHYTRTGYVNTFGGVPDRLNGRLFYDAPQSPIFGLEMLRIASQSDFEACWPMCRDPHACSARRACDTSERRAFAIARARYALAALV